MTHAGGYQNPPAQVVTSPIVYVVVIGNSVTEIGEEAINVPANKANYFKKQLYKELHEFIMELPAEE